MYKNKSQMPNLKSHYALSLGLGSVSIGPLRDGWREWDPFVGIWVGIKIEVGWWGVTGAEIFKCLTLILGSNQYQRNS